MADPLMASSDIKHPSWIPRGLRPAPAVLKDARVFTRDVFGEDRDKAHHIPGWLHPDQAAAICHLAHLSPEGPIVEIGSFKGKSTVFLARGMKATNALYAIDPHLQTDVGSREDRKGGPFDSDETSWATFNRTLETWRLTDRVVGDVFESFSKHPKDVERRKEQAKTRAGISQPKSTTKSER